MRVRKALLSWLVLVQLTTALNTGRGGSDFQCATEKGVCFCKGTVVYGNDPHWSDRMNAEGSLPCNNEQFGDPNPDDHKRCVCRPDPVKSGPVATDFSIVYTWVNGSDPLLRIDAVDFNLRLSVARIRDREELRYSLRSVHKYMPWWNGTVIIVTNHGPPTWLDTSHPRVRVLSHRDIWIDPDTLPTFNSDGIEEHLRVLPTGEHFVYFNDDMFLGNEVALSDFWTSDGRARPRFTMNKVNMGQSKHDSFQKDGKQKWLANIYYTHSLVEKDYGESKAHLFLHHAPYPMRKSVLNMMGEKWPKQARIPIESRTRTYSSIQIPSAHHWICSQTKACDPIFNSSVTNQYVFVTKGKDANEFRSTLKRIKDTGTLFFNLADYPDKQDYEDAVSDLFMDKYPDASSFELPGHPSAFELYDQSKKEVAGTH